MTSLFLRLPSCWSVSAAVGSSFLSRRHELNHVPLTAMRSSHDLPAYGSAISSPERITDADSGKPAGAGDIWAVGRLVRLCTSPSVLQRLSVLFFFRFATCSSTATLLFTSPAPTITHRWSRWPRCTPTSCGQSRFGTGTLAQSTLVRSFVSLSRSFTLLWCYHLSIANPSLLPTVAPEIGIARSPSLRQRIGKEGRVTDPEEVEQLHSFLKACWTLDAQKRPSARELLEHEWLRGVE
jgi:serine/threonine protein kinase